MSLLIDTKYMNIVGFQLEMFSQKNHELWHCRCPICGDSKKNATIRRFYFHVKDNNLLCYCHNCGYSHHFHVFIKNEFPSIYRDYRVEKFKSNTFGGPRRNAPERLESHSARKPVQIPKPDKLNDLDAITDLDRTHPARVYLKERKIPYEILKGLYYTECFASLAERFNPDAAEKMRRGEPRIVIPFLSENGKELLAIQGRSYLPNSNPKFKYITIKTHSDNDKIWGLHRIDRAKPVKVVEGALDAFFVDNCVATCDAALWKYNGGQVYVFDNQPRNVELVKQMKKALDKRLPIVIWPENLEYKDINDMILGGMSVDEVNDLIESNTYTGPKALLKFNRWKKVNT